jgi:dihydropteroate synthase
MILHASAEADSLTADRVSAMNLHAGQLVIRLQERSLLMGIVNVTPDSFSDGGRYLNCHDAVAHAVRLVEEGADLLDIGAESTRPGAIPIEATEELRRLIPVVTAVAKAVTVPISVDTSKASVAKAAIEAGAVIVNDVTALRGDPAMAELIARTGVGIVLMHMQGRPLTMQQAPDYQDVVEDVAAFLSERAQYAMERGIARRQIIVDPGIGFGKVLLQNLDLLARLPRFAQLGYPLLIGPSRKSFIGELIGQPVEARAWGTAAAVAIAVEQGAHILRVHDIGAMRNVVQVASAIARRKQYSLRELHA